MEQSVYGLIEKYSVSSVNWSV